MEWKEEGKNIQSMGIRVSEMECRGFGWTVIDWDRLGLRTLSLLIQNKSHTTYFTFEYKKNRLPLIDF